MTEFERKLDCRIQRRLADDPLYKNAATAGAQRRREEEIAREEERKAIEFAALRVQPEVEQWSTSRQADDYAVVDVSEPLHGVSVRWPIKPDPEDESNLREWSVETWIAEDGALVVNVNTDAPSTQVRVNLNDANAINEEVIA
jgi:hypothetical protein